jgi:hypothetical protein
MLNGADCRSGAPCESNLTTLPGSQPSARTATDMPLASLGQRLPSTAPSPLSITFCTSLTPVSPLISIRSYRRSGRRVERRPPAWTSNPRGGVVRPQHPRATQPRSATHLSERAQGTECAGTAVRPWLPVGACRCQCRSQPWEAAGSARGAQSITARPAQWAE